MGYTGIPSELKLDRLTPITQEPLLNYLVALSYSRGVNFNRDTKLNTIYSGLLNAVHDRNLDGGKYKKFDHLSCEEFVNILEEIALAIWHGDGRAATEQQILKRYENSELEQKLKIFQEGTKKGISKLLAVFYFRKSDQLQGGEKTFEFTHKSFGEYLISRRIVRTVRQVQEDLNPTNELPYRRKLDKKNCLMHWAEICGPNFIDKYLFRFLRDEIHSCEVSELERWQQTFAELLGYAINRGMPMESLGLRDFNEMMRQSCNAEPLLMVVHCACAEKTKTISKINWGDSHYAFGKWFHRNRGQSVYSGYGRIVANCLSWLDLSGATLSGQDFYSAKLHKSLLIKANLYGANLTQAKLTGANLEEANLVGVNFDGARLEGADFSETIFATTKLDRLGAQLNYEKKQA